VARYVDQVADSIDGFSTYLRHTDVGTIVDDAQDFARRQPALFLGGAFLVGTIAARFLKSSRPSASTSGRPGYPGSRGSFSGQYASGYDRPSNYRPMTSSGGYRPTTPSVGTAPYTPTAGTAPYTAGTGTGSTMPTSPSTSGTPYTAGVSTTGTTPSTVGSTGTGGMGGTTSGVGTGHPAPMPATSAPSTSRTTPSGTPNPSGSTGGR
jgi:hypothetical protein